MAVVLEPGRGALLAVGMNGEALPREHGFPVRMVVPGPYGYVSATKWLTGLELTTFADRDTYWVQRGWAALAGAAWAQHVGVDRVEVRTDDGPWREARAATG